MEIAGGAGGFRAGEKTTDAAGGVEVAAEVGAAGVEFLDSIVFVEDGEDEEGVGEVDVAVDGAVGADDFASASEGVVGGGEDAGAGGAGDDVGEAVGLVVLVEEGGVGGEVSVGVVSEGGAGEDDFGGVGGRAWRSEVAGAVIDDGEGVGAEGNGNIRNLEGVIGIAGGGKRRVDKGDSAGG